MLARRIIVIGASSGGIETLQKLTRALPQDLPAAIGVVVHLSPESPALLASILHRSGPLAAETAADHMPLDEGRIYVAPPDHHLLVEPGVLRTTRGPRENRFRPAIDPLFRSAAQVYGPAAVAVVLSGSLDDGTSGLWTIKRMGGIAIVQDPADALFASMPASAIRHVDVDHVVPLDAVAELLDRIVRAPVHARDSIAPPRSLEVEVGIAKSLNPLDAGLRELGEPSPFACPECHGVLLQLDGSHPPRFRCHTGHAFSAESLVSAVDDGIEEALWNAARSLEEGARLLERLSSRHQPEGSEAERLTARANGLRRDADTVRTLVGASPEAPRERR